MIRLPAVVVFVLLALSSFAAGQGAPPEEEMLYSPIAYVVCVIYMSYYYIAGLIAALVFVISGVKWVKSQADPGERKQAKMAMQAVFVGLIIVLIADRVIVAVSPDFEFDCEARVAAGPLPGAGGPGGPSPPPADCAATCADRYYVGDVCSATGCMADQDSYGPTPGCNGPGEECCCTIPGTSCGSACAGSTASCQTTSCSGGATPAPSGDAYCKYATKDGDQVCCCS